MAVNRSKIASLFYFGTLLSSVGSFAFNIALIAFMLQSGFQLWQATLIVGLNRLVLIGATALFGHYSDHFSARLMVAITEVIAAVASLGLFLLWDGPTTNYFLFALLCIVKSAVISFQTGSRAKITKFLSDDSFAGNSRNAIWLNKATQGATLFGGILGWIIVQHFNLQFAIVLDALTFLASGLIAFCIPEFTTKEETARKASWHRKFQDLFIFNGRAAKLDIVLAISMMGTMAFMSRMAGQSQSWTGLYMAGYGLAVWTAGFLERSLTTKMRSAPFWLSMGICFFILGQLQEPSALTLAVMFIKDLCYWVIYHRISSHIQTDTPTQSIGGVVSARMTVMIAILALGEVLVGAWSGFMPIQSEVTIRALVGAAVAVFLFATGTRKVTADGRSTL